MKRISGIFHLIVMFSNLTVLLSFPTDNSNSDQNIEIIYERTYRRLSPKGQQHEQNYYEEFKETLKTRLPPSAYDTSDQVLNKFLSCATNRKNEVQSPEVHSIIKSVLVTSELPPLNYSAPVTTNSLIESPSTSAPTTTTTEAPTTVISPELNATAAASTSNIELN